LLVNPTEELSKRICSIFPKQHLTIAQSLFRLLLSARRHLDLEFLHQRIQRSLKRDGIRSGGLVRLRNGMSQQQRVPHGEVDALAGPRTHQVRGVADERGAGLMLPGAADRQHVQRVDVKSGGLVFVARGRHQRLDGGPEGAEQRVVAQQLRFSGRRRLAREAGRCHEVLVRDRQEDVDARRVLRAALRHNAVAFAERREAAQADQLREVRVFLGDFRHVQSDALRTCVLWFDICQQVADFGPRTVCADDQIERLFAVRSKVEFDFSASGSSGACSRE